MVKIVSLFALAAFLVLTAPACLAKDVDFEASVDKRRIGPDDSIVLSLAFHGTQGVPAPDLSEMEGFHAQYIGPSTMMSIVNGRMSASVTHKYVLIPLRVGTFRLGPFSLEYGGDTYAAPSITVEVVEGRAARRSQPADAPRQKLEFEDRIFVVLEPGKTEAYLNEQIPIKVKLYVNRLSVRDIQYPKLTHDGFSAEPFTNPRQYRETLGGVLYDVIEFETIAFGTRAGTLELGPAGIECNLLLQEKSRRRSVFDEMFGGDDPFDSFFGRYTKHPLDLESRPVSVTILPFPREGRPQNFKGAVGDFDLRFEADPKKVKVGDPITLRMTVEGNGNFKTIDRPSIDFGDKFKVYEPEVTQGEWSKSFEVVIVPKDSGVTEIPEAGFSSFDPAAKRYKEVRRGPIPVEVMPLPKGEELKVFELPGGTIGPKAKKEILGRDIIYIKDNPGRLKRRGEFLYKNKLFVIFQFLPLFAVVGTLLFQKRRERFRTDIRYARKMRAPRKARKNLLEVRRLLEAKEPERFFEAVFKTLQEYIGDKFHLPSAGITASVVGELRLRNIDEELLNKLKKCFEACDTARYAPSHAVEESMRSVLELLQDVIDKFERVRT